MQAAPEGIPQALTDYIKGREGYDYNQHGQAGNTHADFVPDEIVDRFCILGPVATQIERLEELKSLGVDQFAIYLQHDGKDHTLLDHRDLYILEQRGIGSSDDFCPFYSSRNPLASDVATFEESLESALQRKADCAINASAAGVDLRGYNTIENARDVKALRRALGFEKWNVWGISYGSILGQAYVREDPEGRTLPEREVHIAEE